jgi:two-component system nitrogen regulation response regulator NtrX
LRNVHVLIVDDEEGIRESLRGVLEDESYSVETARNVDEGLLLLGKRRFAVALVDVWMPGRDGMALLEEIQKLPQEERPQVIMISGHGTIETAVRATKLGAYDFLEKPLTIEKVTVTIQNALRQKELEAEVARLRHATGEDRSILGDSVPIRALRQQLELMAGTNGRVLIYGESGTGKELVAHAIHRSSARAAGPFVEVNCAAIPEDRIESELFGHRRGAFPGADEDKIGKFEKADGGTLFLDEVGDMSLRTQSKVLRVLDEGRFQPLGSDEAIRADVRVIAATNKNLEVEIERGNFREDLFYRLNVIPFSVPPLRERVEDIRLLADSFLVEFTTNYARKAKELSPEAYQVLEEYPWPGNVRELRNMMERIVIMNPQVRVEARHIPLQSGPNGVRRAPAEKTIERFASLQEVREAAERDYILRTLDEAEGNVTKTAEILGLERSHLYRKMKALGIGPKEN